MIELIAEIFFYGIVVLIAIYSAVTIYVLMRFGQSRFMGLLLSAIFLVAILLLYSSAQIQFLEITFPTL